MNRKVSFSACLLGLILFVSATIGAFLKISPLQEIMPRITYGIDLQGGHRVVLTVHEDQIMAGIHRQIEALVSSHLVRPSINFTANGDIANITHLGSFSLKGDSLLDVSKSFKEEVSFEYPELRISYVGADIQISGIRNLLDKERNSIISNNIQVINSRLNAIGTADVSVYKQGKNKIVIELPMGVDYTKTKQLLLSTSQVNFYLMPNGANSVQMEYRGLPVSRSSTPFIRGESIVEAYAGMDQRTGGVMVTVKLDNPAATIMSDVSGKNVGKPIITTLTQSLIDKDSKQWVKVEEVINVANIQTQLGRVFQISGIDSLEKANSLAVQLKSGALSAPMTIVMEQTIDPRLGADNIESGVKAFVVGLVLLFAYIIYHYKVRGVITCLTLAANVSLITFLLAIMGASFTLTGIAGLVLTMGIAVDANIIVFERFSNETNGSEDGLRQAFEESFSTIMDANITTLLASIVLFNVGSVALKGFAVTLGVGVVSTLITAYVVNKYLLVSLESINNSEVKDVQSNA
ncbi:protein translocase subunit SecD [Vibrio sp. D431a]|uniref:protein translocase subunit SecD n=1 Tax=Vibrio sp. D431a TaxID=2837388 RepID=UPI0025556997|nr:protein translocase subunit SecD [Vibrio sp. D431a]MDK9790614.1 protein translocase subunit SecD [Vibrio sp. D431a]